MLFAIDVGNTNITCGVFEQEKIKKIFRLTTSQPRTSDEYGITLRELLTSNEIDWTLVKDVVIASVVPKVMHSLTSGIIKYFKIQPLVIEPGIKTGVKIVTGNAGQIGADRIVDLAAAYELYGVPVLVVDFGTATTYDLLDENAAFISGVTAPGIRISAKALWEDTAKLPEIEIKKPDSVLGKDTISSMQVGLVYGQIGQVEYIVGKTKEETGLKDLKVVATGGLGSLIAKETDSIDIYDPTLTLQGMRIIYNKQKGRHA
jgi:type III pantothenate kinase